MGNVGPRSWFQCDVTVLKGISRYTLRSSPPQRLRKSLLPGLSTRDVTGRGAGQSPSVWPENDQVGSQSHPVTCPLLQACVFQEPSL